MSSMTVVSALITLSSWVSTRFVLEVERVSSSDSLEITKKPWLVFPHLTRSLSWCVTPLAWDFTCDIPELFILNFTLHALQKAFGCCAAWIHQYFSSHFFWYLHSFLIFFILLKRITIKIKWQSLLVSYQSIYPGTNRNTYLDIFFLTVEQIN